MSLSPLKRSLPLVALLSACAARDVQAPVPQRGKPQAPVELGVELGSTRGVVTARFLADAEDGRVELHGAGGLTLDGPSEPMILGAIQKGEERRWPISWQRTGPGGLVVVNLAGTFGGSWRHRVASFQVGQPVLEPPVGHPVDTSRGQHLKVVPVTPAPDTARP